MIEEDIIAYIYAAFAKEGLLIIIACYVLGQILVKCVKHISNDLTVPIISLTGAILMLLIPTIYADDPLTVRLIKGVILGWSSTGLHELMKGLVRLGVIKIPGYKLRDNSTKDDVNEENGVG